MSTQIHFVVEMRGNDIFTHRLVLAISYGATEMV